MVSCRDPRRCSDDAESSRVKTRPTDAFWAVELTASVLCKRWKGAVVAALLPGGRRFGELARSLPGVSGKVLAQRMRELEAEAIVVRSHTADARRASYRLTVIGQQLGHVVSAFQDWGVAYHRANARALARHGLVQLYDSSRHSQGDQRARY